MGHKTIRHTIKRNGVYYVRFRLPDNKFLALLNKSNFC